MDRDYQKMFADRGVWWTHNIYAPIYTNNDENEEGEDEMADTEPKKFWMITGDGNAPKVRHYNRNDAVSEASRLAKTNPGKEFFVMETVEMMTQPSGVVRHRF